MVLNMFDLKSQYVSAYEGLKVKILYIIKKNPCFFCAFENSFKVDIVLLKII